MVPDLAIPLCSVCEIFPADAGGLSCTHRFCEECFDRYIHGSVQELHTSLRCSVCGHIGDLIQTLAPSPQTLTHTDAVVTYGRNGSMKITGPCGFAQHHNGDFIVIDKTAKRVKLFSEYGRPNGDFAYVFNTEPTVGVAVTSNGQIAVASKDASYESVNYYTISGAFCGSTYVQSSSNKPDIQGMTCDTEKDWLFLSDRSDSCIHVINNRTKLQINRIELVPIQYETSPEPKGIAIGRKGELIIADVANNCVKLYSQDGVFLKKIGCYGDRPLQFKSPTGVAVTSRGELIIADRGNQRVQLLDADGSFIRHVVCFKKGYDVFMAPDDVISSANGDISVLMTSTQAATIGEVRVYR